MNCLGMNKVYNEKAKDEYIKRLEDALEIVASDFYNREYCRLIAQKILENK